MVGAVGGVGQDLGATVIAETRALKVPAQRVQAPMPARYTELSAQARTLSAHRPFCGGECTDESQYASAVHGMLSATRRDPINVPDAHQARAADGGEGARVIFG